MRGVDEEEEHDPILTRDRLVMEAELDADMNFLRPLTIRGSKGIKNALGISATNQ